MHSNLAVIAVIFSQNDSVAAGYGHHEVHSRARAARNSPPVSSMASVKRALRVALPKVISDCHFAVQSYQISYHIQYFFLK